MKTDLSQDQIESYRENGFLSYPGMLAPKEVAELKTAVLDAVTTLGDKKIVTEGTTLTSGDDYYDRVFIQRLNLWLISDVVKEDMLSADIGRMVCELAGVEGIRVWHDQTLIKEPFGNPTAWHLDNPYWSFTSCEAVSLWIALDDAMLENGCMWFIPGSHRIADYRNVSIGFHMADLFKIYPEMADIDPVAVPMKAGDCSFHNGLVAHGAGANMTRTRRAAMTCAYMPDGSTFNGKKNILSDEMIASLKVGDVLNNDEQNPLIYHKMSSSV